MLELHVQITRDPDVLDTWFSSALWPISTMGWPTETPELKTWNPSNLLCTAREIITLWVSRMVMFNCYFRDCLPFTDVFIHAMIQDGEGRKMSKSLGNGIDPIDIIDSHGADAMRFTLVAMTTQTQDVRMPVEQMTLPDGRVANTSPKFDIGRNFCNKLWNASRFALMNLDGLPVWADIRPTEKLEDRWILSRLQRTIRDVTAAAEAFRFNDLADTLYHFMWDDFCDWYLEIAKARIADGQDAPKAILAHCLDVLLRLLHPVCPFITEAIWAHLNEAAPIRSPGDEPAESLLAKARWPLADSAAVNDSAEAEFATLQEIVRQIRNARTQHNVPPGREVSVAVEAAGRLAELVEANAELIASQASAGEVALRREGGEAPRGAAAIIVAGAKVYVLDIIDVAAERSQLEKQAKTLRRGIEGIEKKLSNESFLSKAPAEVVERERERLAVLRRDLAAVEKSLGALGEADTP
jgi:valyl-tRNA synthetase